MYDVSNEVHALLGRAHVMQRLTQGEQIMCTGMKKCGGKLEAAQFDPTEGRTIYRCTKCDREVAGGTPLQHDKIPARQAKKGHSR